MKTTSVFLLSILTIFSHSTELMIYQEDSNDLLLQSSDFTMIQQTLQVMGVRFQKWDTYNWPDNVICEEQIEKMYAKEISLLQEQEGFGSYDVLSISSAHLDKKSLRRKFLFEHTHNEPEIRFFVEGSGVFYLHIDNKVISVLCERGDLISVPENIAHWFDMGKDPSFSVIRFFTKKEGWIAYPTGSAIAEQYVRE